MSPRRLLTLFTTTLLLAMAGVANAQAQLPPPISELENGRPWTYDFGWMILVAALALVAAVVLGYLVKSREFRANQRRGGSK
jgi:H+/gluconate symporter-like permease